MTDENKERESYGSGRSSQYGYIVEWRLKPESAVIGTVLAWNDVKEDWSQAHYQIDKLGRLDSPNAERLVLPYIHGYASDERARHGLVDKPVAIAIIACLETAISEKMLEHIQWRIVRVHLETTHKLTRSVDGKEDEGRMMQFERLMREA